MFIYKINYYQKSNYNYNINNKMKGSSAPLIPTISPYFHLTQRAATEKNIMKESSKVSTEMLQAQMLGR